MAFEAVTDAEMIRQLRAALLQRTREYDTGYGVIADLFAAIGVVLRDQANNRVRRLSQLLTLSDPTVFTDAEIDGRIISEGVTRPTGSAFTTELVFESDTQPSLPIIIERGFPVASVTTEGTSQSYVYVTTEAVNQVSIGQELDDDGKTYYRVRVPAVSLFVGEAARVGPNRLTRPLRPLTQFSRVYNPAASEGGRNTYTNSELVELYLLALAGRQLASPTGLDFYVRDTFNQVDDVNVVYGSNPVITRASYDAGAVDVFILGTEAASTTDSVFYMGVGQTHVLSQQPIIDVTSVTRTSPSAATYTEGVDYEVVRDTTGLGGSTRARDGIRFLTTAATPPSEGDTLSIAYRYNNLIGRLQADALAPEAHVFGMDKLFRAATEVDVYISARLTVLPSFGTQTVSDLVRSSLLSYFDTLKMGRAGAVEASDIQGVVRRLSGVDNFVITRLTRSATSNAVADIIPADNEKPILQTQNLVITA